MKIILTTLITVFLGMSVGLYGQSSAIDRYFEEYKLDERFSQITVSSKMFSLFVNFELDDPAEQELVETISKLKGLKTLVGMEIPESREIYDKVVRQPEGNMDELMSVKDGSAEFKFFMTESEGKISELLMVGFDTSKVMMLSLVGEIDLKQIAALSRKMNIDGFEHFQNIDK